jgi:hypothetical protein
LLETSRMDTFGQKRKQGSSMRLFEWRTNFSRQSFPLITWIDLISLQETLKYLRRGNNLFGRSISLMVKLLILPGSSWWQRLRRIKDGNDFPMQSRVWSLRHSLLKSKQSDSNDERGFFGMSSPVISLCDRSSVFRL